MRVMREIMVELFLNELLDLEIFLIVDDEYFWDGGYLLKLLKLIHNKFFVANGDVSDGKTLWERIEFTVDAFSHDNSHMTFVFWVI